MTNTLTTHEQRVLEGLRAVAISSLPKWRIDCKEITLIKYRENAVFKVTAVDGKKFALRVHRSGYHSDAALLSELQWMTALQDCGIQVPLVVPTTEHELFIREDLYPDGEPVQIDLFEWIDGLQIGTAESGLGENTGDIERTYRTIGNIAARLHNHGTQWTLPERFQRHAWDIEGLVGEQPLWGRFWDLETLTPDQRELMITARDIARAELKALSETSEHASCYGLIHADFVPENLLVADGIVRIIDFDDAGFGWHLFEIATALYFIRDDPNYRIAHDALINGYREYRPLSDSVLTKLPLFMMARGFTYLGWMHTRKDTDTARQLTAFVTELACDVATTFVSDYRRRSLVDSISVKS